MNKKSIWGCLLLLAPILGISCADLRDSDQCFRYARLVCEKGCATDKNACIESNRGFCHELISESDSSETQFNDCSDKLDGLEDCVGEAKVKETCAVSPVMNKTCSFSGDCSLGETCVLGMCVKPSDGSCQYQSDCLGSKYCASDYQCRESCVDSFDCADNELCSYDSNSSQKLCTPNKMMPQPTSKGNIADTCDVSSDCDSSYGLTCAQNFCSKQCKSTSDCTAASSKAVCAGSQGIYICTLPCVTSLSCPGEEQCADLYLASGGPQKACYPASTTPTPTTEDIGGPCEVSSDCSSSLVCQQGICTKSCTSNDNCLGDTYTDKSAVCAGSLLNTRTCLAGCTQGGTDCATGSTCTLLPNANGGTSYVCRPGSGSTPKANLGDACEQPSDCDQTQGLSCSGNMCIKPCGSSLDCPPASEGESSQCFQNICTRTCGNRACPGSWICEYDSNSGNDICMR